MKSTSPRYIKQYAVGIIDYSSQYGGENPRSFSYSVSNIIGEPKIFPKYGDFTQAAVMRTYGPWWNRCLTPKYKKDTRPRSSSFQSQDYIDVIFDKAVFPWSIAIYETYNPGAIVRILALCQEFPKQNTPSYENNNDGVDPDICGKAIPLPLVEKYTHWEVLWSNPNPQFQTTKEARMFAPILQEINHRSRIIRLEFCHTHLDYYTELDAVELTGTLTYTSSSPVDPPSRPMSSLSIHDSPNSSSENLAYSESKADFQNQDSEIIGINEGTIVVTKNYNDVLPNGYFIFLPPEIMSKIFSYLPFPDFCRAACVCKLFHAYSYDPSQLASVDLHSYWHIVNNNTLHSIQSRCSPSAIKGTIRSLSLKWLGGGDIVTPDQLNNFIKSCDFRALTFLDLASSPSLTDALLGSLVKYTSGLSHLDIQSCDKATSEGIRILHKLTKLQSLNLYRTKVDDAGLICIIHSNPSLLNLNIGSCTHIRDYDRVLVELSEHSHNLRALDTWRAKSLTSLGLKALASQCKHLEELDFGWCGGLQSSTGCFQHLAKSCPHLRKLFLTTNRTVSDVEVNMFAQHLTKLRQFDILGTRLVTPQSVERLLNQCNDLEFLDVSFCYSFTLDIVKALRQTYPHVEIKRSFQD
ncbi:unnamed protein product [Clavelina lepadiformis]|uniref:F-box domain-containing protein n=1 Tax=Clavelina lepadiformis TaxID=159417 RepID=A0ABP0FGD3_CLALP